MPAVAFIGLGVMGYPMAGHLVRAGHDVTVFNRTDTTAQRWVAEYGGHAADSPRVAAGAAEFVFTCVGADDDVRAVVLGDQGALAGMQPGAVLVDHTTASAHLARELDAACRACGVGFVDAPVSGGQVGAQNGVLTVMCGGDAGSFHRALPVIEAYGRTITHLGPAGCGQLTKMVNQILCAAAIEGAAEAMRKDLRICLGEAAALGAKLPITASIETMYAELQRLGANRLDATSIIRLLRD